MGEGQNLDGSFSRAIGTMSFGQSAPDCMSQWAEQLMRRQIQWIKVHSNSGEKTASGQEARAEIQVGSGELRSSSCLYNFWLPFHFFPLCSPSILFLFCSSFSHLFIQSSCFFTFHMLFWPVFFFLQPPSVPYESTFSSLSSSSYWSALCQLLYFLFFWLLEWGGVLHY